MDSNQNGARGGNECMNNCGLQEGAGAATLKTVATNGTTDTEYTIDGQFYTYDDTDNIAMTALAIQADLYSCLYLVTVTSAQAIAIKKGTQRLTADVTSGKYPLEWPEPSSDDVTAIGGFRIDNDGGTFTSGTTDLATVVGLGTVTYFDFNRIPAAPITA